MARIRSVIVVGGGVVGLCVAHYAVREGIDVTIVERGGPDHNGCSLGNAGMIVPSHFVPLAAPGVFTAAILTFFFAWNDFVFGISLTSTGRARTVPAALAFFTGASQFEQPTAAIATSAP